MKTEISKITKFLKEAFNSIMNGYEGCFFYEVPGCEGLHIVVSMVDHAGDEVCAKVAYNCDDLQYDYESDWYRPTYATGDMKDYPADTEVPLGKPFRPDAEYLYKQARELTKALKAGEVYDWRD